MVGTRGQSTKSAAVDTPRSRQKTKATPIKSAKSPDLVKAKRPGDEASVSTSSSKRPGLDPHVQKALAEILEGEGGGLKNYRKAGSHSLSKLLDTDPDTFGQRGDQLRVQISNYVFRWAKDPDKYEKKVLNRWQIVSASNRKREDKSKVKADEVSDAESLSESSTDSSVKALSKQSKKSKRGQSKKKESKPPTEVFVTKAKAETEKTPTYMPKTSKFSSSKEESSVPIHKSKQRQKQDGTMSNRK